MDIYVGNIAYSVSAEELQEVFEQYGDVKSARIINDHETGRSRGYGFVTMPNRPEAEEAIEQMSGNQWEGRRLTVREANPKKGGINKKSAPSYHPNDYARSEADHSHRVLTSSH